MNTISLNATTLQPGGDHMEVTLVFDRERETKNKVRYQERSADECLPIIGPLYVAKFWAGDAKQLTVSLTTEMKRTTKPLQAQRRRRPSKRQGAMGRTHSGDRM